MSREISKFDDVIDSRDVIARINDLESERDSFEPEGFDDAAVGAEDLRAALWAEANPEEAEELKVLTAVQEEASGYASDWRHGESLIRDSYFEDYARQLAEDIGAIKGNESWPLSYIDWEAAAEALKMDYTSVDFDGVEFWIRM
jgi:hypothetical protein